MYAYSNTVHISMFMLAHLT